MDMSVSASGAEVERDEQAESATAATPNAPVEPKGEVKIVFVSVVGVGIGLVAGLIIALVTGLLPDLC